MFACRTPRGRAEMACRTGPGLVLHVGTTKTGSSSIQKTCHEARGRLAAQGVRYFDWALNHSLLQAAFLEDAAEAPMLRHWGYHEAEARRALGREARSALEAFLAQLGTATGVISGEALADLPPRAVARMAAILDRYGVEPLVVVYVRPPMAYANSLAQQHVRNGMTFEQIRRESLGAGGREGPGAPASIRPNYRMRIEKYREVFGPQRVLVRIFARDRLAGGDVVEDFLRLATGRGCADLGIEPLRANESLDHAAVMCLEAINRVEPPLIEGGPNPNRARSLVNGFLAMEGGAPFHLPGFDWARFAALIAEDVAWLAEATGGEIEFALDPPGDGPAEADFSAVGRLLNERVAELERVRPEARALALLLRLLAGQAQAAPPLRRLVPRLTDPRTLVPLARVLAEAGHADLAAEVARHGLAHVPQASPQARRLRALRRGHERG